MLKTKAVLPFGTAVVPPGIYPNELKTIVHTKACMRMLTAVLRPNSEVTKMSFGR